MRLLDLLICPECLPGENGLRHEAGLMDGGEIMVGTLFCGRCGVTYEIVDGVACILPSSSAGIAESQNKYETDLTVSSYLWSHYGDIMGESYASDAYRQWADRLPATRGFALDAGAAVGRFTFEMSARCDFAVGVDTSRAFIRMARDLMRNRKATMVLKEEGNLTREADLVLPDGWTSENVEFIVADAQALPFRSSTFAAAASLNLADKIPKPIRHLREIDRVSRKTDARFLLSDPFSWSEEATAEADWLGGTTSGPYAGRGIDNVAAILAGELDGLSHPWTVEGRGEVWWKIRTHANHFESIRSLFVSAAR